MIFDPSRLGILAPVVLFKDTQACGLSVTTDITMNGCCVKAANKSSCPHCSALLSVKHHPFPLHLKQLTY